jgi:hypothetical protein
VLGGRAVASSQGWAEIGGKRHYFRSKAERNYARYLEWLKQHHLIFEWSYESITYWFDGIKRGVRSYKPDFEVWGTESSKPVIHEVKGWMDPQSKTKLKRMAKYYPKVKLVVIDKKHIAEIRKKVGALIQGWEA